jgi:hypothetical protein
MAGVAEESILLGMSPGSQTPAEAPSNADAADASEQSTMLAMRTRAAFLGRRGRIGGRQSVVDDACKLLPSAPTLLGRAVATPECMAETLAVQSSVFPEKQSDASISAPSTSCSAGAMSSLPMLMGAGYRQHTPAEAPLIADAADLAEQVKMGAMRTRAAVIAQRERCAERQNLLNEVCTSLSAGPLLLGGSQDSEAIATIECMAKTLNAQLIEFSADKIDASMSAPSTSSSEVAASASLPMLLGNRPNKDIRLLKEKDVEPLDVERCGQTWHADPTLLRRCIVAC